MAELLSYIGKEWGVIGQAPLTFITLVLLSIAAAYFAASWRFGGIIASQQGEIKLLERKLATVPGGTDHERNKAYRESLGVYLRECEGLQERTIAKDTQPLIDEANEWSGRVSAFLEGTLGTDYLARFSNDAGLSGQTILGAGITTEQRSLWEWLNRRSERLHEFIREFR